MKYLHKIASGINVIPLQLELKRNAQLWNTNTQRTEHESSPHHQVDDIWVRYAGSYEEGQSSHMSEWMTDLLPSAKQHARAIMNLVNGDALGGVLITRIPPGAKVLPHVDRGWHAEYYDKFILQVEAHPQQAFCYEDGQFVSQPGDLYWFYNQQEHWIINDSPIERISLIVCVKLEKPFNGGA
jgi:hypothetical protein